MLMFQHDGESCFSGVWTAVTTAKGFDALLLNPPQAATHWMRYTGGATAALKLNELLTGGTSASTCRLVGQAVEVGTAGSSDTGIIFVNVVSGAFQAETLTGGTTTGTIAIVQDFLPMLARTKPKAALITVEGFAVNFSLSGIAPTVAAGTNYGEVIAAGGSYVVRGWNNIRNFRCINTVASSGSIVKYELFY